ncbi:hypothetical protein AG1IA_07644 [Rhizoctonia solani AG-1 IA]|uniref:Transmembrane protein n=1 Tax=Thanatephorus cucumeris (strain AG1-IA) TaxID=983506 RepID=L8WPS0_THACA|nr:hypothetical protein AG1IA_07644 [Rhizoctonia solani AG-1 IA]
MFHCNVETIPGRDRGRPLVFPIKLTAADSGVPYIMPNALTMFLFWNLIFMLLMQPYIWLNYFAYHTPSLQLTSRMYFWYGFVFIWDATGMWTSAFGTLYATLLPKLFTVTPSSHSALRGFLLHPITLNVLCFMPPSGLALTQVITSTYSAIAWSDLVHTQFGLIDLLKMLAGQWAQSATHDLDRALAARADDMGTLFLIQKDKSQVAFQKNAWTCKPNSLLPAAHSDTINQRTRRVTPHAPPPTSSNGLPIQQPHPTAFGDAQPRSSFAPFSQGRQAATNAPYKQPNTPGAVGANWTTNSQAGQNNGDSIKPLKRALLTASLQFAATFFCLGVASGSWLWIAADAGRLIVKWLCSPTLHALAILLTIWVYVIVGCLVNLFILIRTRRPDDSSTSGNNMPLSAIKASHASSSQSHTRSELERKPVYIVAHTTTHVVVDDPGHRSSGSDHAVDVTSGGRQPYDGQGDMESAYSLSSAHFADDPAKIKALDDVEWSNWRSLKHIARVEGKMAEYCHDRMVMSARSLISYKTEASVASRTFFLCPAALYLSCSHGICRTRPLALRSVDDPNRSVPEHEFEYRDSANPEANSVRESNVSERPCRYNELISGTTPNPSPARRVPIRVRSHSARQCSPRKSGGIVSECCFSGRQPNRSFYHWLGGVPYIVPNALMMFLLFNGIFALLMQPYIWIVSLSSVRLADILPEVGLLRTNASVFRYGFIFIFDGSGMWISAFGTFYGELMWVDVATMLSSSIRSQQRQVLVHPAWHDMLLLEFDVVDNLNILSRQWKSGGIDQSLWNQTLVISKPLLGKILESRAAFVRNAATTGGQWILFRSSLIIGADLATRSLRKLWVPDLQLEALGPISSLHPPSSRTSGSEQTTPTSAASLTPEYQDAQAQERVHDPGGKTAKKLQTAFYSAMLQFIATGFCLGAAAGSWIWAATDVRLKAIGFRLPKMMDYFDGVWRIGSSQEKRDSYYEVICRSRSRGCSTNLGDLVLLPTPIFGLGLILMCGIWTTRKSIAMSFGGSHRSAGSLSANQAPPSPFANKLRLANPSGTLLPPIPPPAPLGLPDMDTISLESNRSKPQPIPPRRSTSPLRGTSAFDRSMDPEIEDEEETPWGERPAIASSPMSSSPGMNRFASSFATRVNALFADSHQNKPRMSDAEIEAEAERSREASRREAERILTEEAEARRKVEEATLAQRAKEREQQQRIMERAQLGRPVTPTRGMSLSPVASPKREGTKEGESSWWEMAKSKLTPTKEKDLTPSQQIVAEARKQEKEREKDKGKKSIDWPATPGIRSTDPTLLAMAAASRLAASPINDNQFMSGTLSSSPERQQTYSPKPIMPHEQLAREIEAQGGGRINGDFFGTRLSTDGAYMSTPSKSSLPFVSRATPSPAPSPLQPARAQTSPEQIGLSSAGTPLGGRSPNVSPERLPHLEKDKKFSPVEDKDKVAEREKEKDRRTATTITTTTTNDDAPPLYAQFTPAGALDVALTLLTVARRFEKLEKWTVGHVRALEERMKDVER